jgi:Pentapeptide repeats (8 copies)
MIAMKDVLSVIDRIVSAEDDDFEGLTKVADLNPARDFRGSDLTGVNFGTADLTGYDFSDANLRGANFGGAKIDSLIRMNAVTNPKTKLPRGERVELPTYGPFHRIESPTQTQAEAIRQKEAGLVTGTASRGSSGPSVKAYRGPLNENVRGVEFYTSVQPTVNAGSPFEARWYCGSNGVELLNINGQSFAAIPVVISKFAQE